MNTLGFDHPVHVSTPAPTGLLALDCSEELAQALFQRLQTLAHDVSMKREGPLVSYQWG